MAGAIPLIRPLRESLAGERIVRVMGIVNGTTNFILTRMTEDGVDYDEALAEAQRLGFAERDPTADVEGDDAAAKAAILASLAFGGDVVGGDVHREGITGVRAVDVAFADRLGYVVKLLAVAERVDGGPDVSVRVHPAMVPRSHPLAAVRGAFNAVFVEGEAAGELMLYGRGRRRAARRPAPCSATSSTPPATSAPGAPAPAPRRGASRIRPVERAALRLLPEHRRGRPTRRAGRGGRRSSGTTACRSGSMEQVGLGDEARLIFLTHVAREGDVQATVDDLRRPRRGRPGRRRAPGRRAERRGA